MDTKATLAGRLAGRLPGGAILLLLGSAWTAWRICTAARRIGGGRHGADRQASAN